MPSLGDALLAYRKGPGPWAQGRPTSLAGRLLSEGGRARVPSLGQKSDALKCKVLGHRPRAVPEPSQAPERVARVT